MGAWPLTSPWSSLLWGPGGAALSHVFPEHPSSSHPYPPTGSGTVGAKLVLHPGAWERCPGWAFSGDTVLHTALLTLCSPGLSPSRPPSPFKHRHVITDLVEIKNGFFYLFYPPLFQEGFKVGKV